MPSTLSPIPLGTPIVDEEGRINEFYRLRWQELIDRFTTVPTVALLESGSPDPNSATATTVAYTTLTGGPYQIAAYSRKTIADGVSSSLQLTFGWTENGVALTKTFAAVTADSITTSVDSQQWEIAADANTDITFAYAYASNTPGNMHYRYQVTVKQVAS
jgi:hypothetical protein